MKKLNTQQIDWLKFELWQSGKTEFINKYNQEIHDFIWQNILKEASQIKSWSDWASFCDFLDTPVKQEI